MSEPIQELEKKGLVGQRTEGLDTLAGNRHGDYPARTVATIQHKGIENHYIMHARAILRPLGDTFRPSSGKGPYKRDEIGRAHV